MQDTIDCIAIFMYVITFDIRDESDVTINGKHKLVGSCFLVNSRTEVEITLKHKASK